MKNLSTAKPIIREPRAHNGQLIQLLRQETEIRVLQIHHPIVLPFERPKVLISPALTVHHQTTQEQAASKQTGTEMVT